MTLLDSSTPEQHRARYEELKRNAQSRLGRSVPRAEHDVAEITDIVRKETIPDGWYWTTRIARGQRLRIVNPTGRATVSALIWNAADTSERYNAGDTVKIQWNALLGKGDLLFSDMGRVLASIVEDSGTGHDFLLGASTQATNAARYGAGLLRNTRDNFCLAVAKLGLQRRDIGPCISFFAPIKIDTEGAFAWKDDAIKPGDFVELRAEMDLIIVLSNCPHPLDPRTDYAPGSVDAIVWQGPPTPADDLCRTASEEAVRGFENTDALFAGE